MRSREEIKELAKNIKGALFAIEIAKLSLEVQLDIRDLLVEIADSKSSKEA
jgi:hypothetical protein